MDAKSRRQAILTRLREASAPVSASTLGDELGVSRQIVVGDVALLRAAHESILATNRGYLLTPTETRPRRRLRVRHTKEQIRTELEAIVDAGGTVVDTIVEHAVYGTLTAAIPISNRTEVAELVARFGTAPPLFELTDGRHMHTIEAATEPQLDLIEERLADIGFLDAESSR